MNRLNNLFPSDETIDMVKEYIRSVFWCFAEGWFIITLHYICSAQLNLGLGTIKHMSRSITTTSQIFNDAVVKWSVFLWFFADNMAFLIQLGDFRISRGRRLVLLVFAENGWRYAHKITTKYFFKELVS